MSTLLRFRDGAGPPLVLLHGLGTDWRVWSPMLPALTPHADVLAFDLPGLGIPRDADRGSAPGDGAAPPASIDHLADVVARELVAAGVGEPLVAGASLGGWVALELARRSLVRAAVAIAPAGLALGAERAYAVQSMRAIRFAARLVTPARDVLAASPVFKTVFFGQTRARPWAVPADMAAAELAVLAEAPAFTAVLNGVVAQETASRLAEIDRPVLIAWGGRDRLLAPWQARRFTNRIPGARLEIIPAAGHVAMTDTPETLARLMVRFFELAPLPEGTP